MYHFFIYSSVDGHLGYFHILAMVNFAAVLKIYIYFTDYFKRGRKRERDRELETSMREKYRSAASCTSPTGDMPSTKVQALDRNRTWDLLVLSPMLYPLSQTVRAQFFCFVFFFHELFFSIPLLSACVSFDLK
uniref:Uncharacterized protein n=1 Tax=Myotis myotis TaxID=51298 RepID=A0A7J7ZY91_MYOMY|nr:hypothetical protein mMyoMyo1_009732 [Myotis myotis]